MNFLAWIGLVVVFWLLVGLMRYITLRKKKDISKTWKAFAQCLVFWPFSFWEA